MITRLQLHNWRAYENLDLEFGPGATFIVASNGIGKTSLIMALAWGLFGEESDVEAAREIRGDADSTTVVIDVRFPSGGDIRIARSVNRKKKITLKADLPDRTITTQSELDALLTDEFGAEPHVLAQLTVMMHGGAVDTAVGEFELRDHLAGVFGVTPLFDAARAAKTVTDRAGSETRKLKTARRTGEKERTELEDDLNGIERDLGEIRTARGAAVRDRDAASLILDSANEWSRFQARTKQRQDAMRPLVQRASELLQRSLTAEDVIFSLEEAERSLLSVASDSEGKAASAQGKTELIEAAMSQLEGAESVCPTCLRPMSEHEAEQAETEHLKHLRELAVVVDDARNEAQRNRERATDVRRVLDEIRELPIPLKPTSAPVDLDVDEAREEIEIKQSKIDEHDQRLAILGTSTLSVEESLKELDEADQIAKQLERVYRMEAIGAAAADSLEATGKAIMKRYIEPLAQEIEMRWKKVFGSGGLEISPEGHLTRRVGTRQLGFESFSGGEKVWAQLLTRLLVTSASTKAPFVWLDEPLEHLDPRLRKIVAGTLAKATSGVGIRQVIVTTYESELARQLMEDVRSASLIYVTTSP